MDNDLEQRVKKLEAIVFSLVGSSQYKFQRDAHFSDGRNIQTGYQSGTKIGTDANQKLGFYGATPISKPSAPATLANVIALLQSLGLSQ